MDYQKLNECTVGEMKYVNVIVENKSRQTDAIFTYRSCSDDISAGDKVIVPFGKSNKGRAGFVSGITDSPDCAVDKIKDVIEIVKNEALSEEMIKTALWMKQRYAVRYYDAVRCFAAEGKPAANGKTKEPYKDAEGSYTEPESLTEEQQNAVNRINNAISQNDGRNFLLHGVTASGKTQVYMEAIEKVISAGRTAVMLVPEISLTVQLIRRFAGRFGKENIAVMHSRLTARERYDEWQRIRQGKARIVIGARMGVFAPLDNIGIIILDEEHEETYKSDRTPKYDTVEVALKRVRFYNGILLLGSATPSVTSYQRCREGIYELIELKERYNRTPLPKVDIVDMRDELRAGNTSIFSRRLYGEIDSALESKEQVILFQNRRGYSSFVSCRECGFVLRCRDCGISLTYHKNSNALVCHYCGKKFPVPEECPSCRSRYIKYFGTGTEQVEEAVKELFPDACVSRLDLDSAKRRGDMDKIIDDFADRKTDILIGTQMVAKGLDFDNVGVVGVISADVTLNIPDYRSAERTYQLITQVSGRAGRGSRQGKVVVQTYEPDNYAIKAAASNDYDSFFSLESMNRKYMDYPPFSDIIMAEIASEDENEAFECAQRCRTYMENAIKNAACDDADAQKGKVLSPRISVKDKGKAEVKYYVLIKCPKGQRNRYVYYLDCFLKILIKEKSKCRLGIDINPYSFY